MTLEDEILLVMSNFIYQKKLYNLYKKYLISSPLVRYKLYLELKHYDIEVSYEE